MTPWAGLCAAPGLLILRLLCSSACWLFMYSFLAHSFPSCYFFALWIAELAAVDDVLPASQPLGEIFRECAVTMSEGQDDDSRLAWFWYYEYTDLSVCMCASALWSLLNSLLLIGVTFQGFFSFIWDPIGRTFWSERKGSKASEEDNCQASPGIEPGFPGGGKWPRGF